MKFKKRHVPFLLALVFVSACLAPQRVSVVEGGSYDSAKDQTSYFVTPYGSVNIPGKWTKTHRNNTSFQQFFVNSDTVEISVAFGATNQFPFNRNGALTGHRFVKAYYEWDSQYMVKAYGLNRQIVEEDSTNHFLIHRIYGKVNGAAIDTYYLTGEKNRNVSMFTVSVTDKWTTQRKVDFLRGLFLDKAPE